MLKQGISFLFFKNKIFLTIVCIIIAAFISTTELLSEISPLISMVKKKRGKKKKKSADKWRLDSGYISPVITLLYLDIETEELQPVHGDWWVLSMDVVWLLFFTGGCRSLFGPANTQVDSWKALWMQRFLLLPKLGAEGDVL